MKPKSKILIALSFLTCLTLGAMVMAAPAPEIKGIYLTAPNFASAYGAGLIDKLVAAGGNAVTIDADAGGMLAFRPQNQALKALNPGSDLIDLPATVRALHARGIYVAFRVTVFHNGALASLHLEWRVRNRDGSLPGGEVASWLDPSMPGAQRYNLSVIEELAQAGVDEVQLDYVRFPANSSKWLDFHYDEKHFTRADIIDDFLKKAHAITAENGVKLAVDTFGGVVWGEVDWKIVGQHIPTLAQYVDVIYPMTYVANFSDGFHGYHNIKNKPYALVHDTLQKFYDAAHSLAKKPPELRVWIQGFASEIHHFTPEFIQDQITAARDAGTTGFMVWNIWNEYGMSWGALK